MNTVTAFMGVGLFGTIGTLLFLSVGFIGKMPPTVSAMVKNPRFMAGCICLVLTAVCAFAML